MHRETTCRRFEYESRSTTHARHVCRSTCTANDPRSASFTTSIPRLKSATSRPHFVAVVVSSVLTHSFALDFHFSGMSAPLDADPIEDGTIDVPTVRSKSACATIAVAARDDGADATDAEPTNFLWCATCRPRVKS